MRKGSLAQVKQRGRHNSGYFHLLHTDISRLQLLCRGQFRGSESKPIEKMCCSLSFTSARSFDSITVSNSSLGRSDLKILLKNLQPRPLIVLIELWRPRQYQVTWVPRESHDTRRRPRSTNLFPVVLTVEFITRSEVDQTNVPLNGAGVSEATISAVLGTQGGCTRLHGSR